MLLNRERATQVMEKHGLDGLVAAFPENIQYLSDYYGPALLMCAQLHGLCGAAARSAGADRPGDAVHHGLPPGAYADLGPQRRRLRHLGDALHHRRAAGLRQQSGGIRRGRASAQPEGAPRSHALSGPGGRADEAAGSAAHPPLRPIPRQARAQRLVRAEAGAAGRRPGRGQARVRRSARAGMVGRFGHGVGVRYRRAQHLPRNPDGEERGGDRPCSPAPAA